MSDDGNEDLRVAWFLHYAAASLAVYSVMMVYIVLAGGDVTTPLWTFTVVTAISLLVGRLISMRLFRS